MIPVLAPIKKYATHEQRDPVIHPSLTLPGDIQPWFPLNFHPSGNLSCFGF